MTLIATVSNRSKEHAGKLLYPSKNAEGSYVASLSRFEADYVFVETEEQLEALVSLGYGARMFNSEIKGGPSLISSKSIEATGSIDIESVLTKLADEQNLDVTSTVKKRAEQSLLRAYHLRGCKTGICTLCGNELPENLLVASHIKLRSKCTKEEKLDFKNIATLMCKLGCDDLYEKGYVALVKGEIVRNRTVETTKIVKESINLIEGNSVRNWKGSGSYYEWHAKKWGVGS